MSKQPTFMRRAFGSQFKFIFGFLFALTATVGLANSVIEYHDIRCESHGFEYAECHVGNGQVVGVSVKQQLSAANCVGHQNFETDPSSSWVGSVQGTFGFQSDKIWVQGGCRADFTAVVAVQTLPIPVLPDQGSCTANGPYGLVTFQDRGQFQFDQRLIEVTAPQAFTWVLLGVSNRFQTVYSAGPFNIYEDGSDNWHWTFATNSYVPGSQVSFVINATNDNPGVGQSIGSCVLY